MSMSQGLRGLDKTIKAVTTFQKKWPEGVGKAMEHEAVIDLGEMQERVPKDTGELHDSGDVLKAVITPKQVSVQIVFTAPHALVVHEDLEAFHDNGQAKFMSSVLNESAPFIAHRIAARLKLVAPLPSLIK